jgi:hypothetical protein
MDIRLQKQLVKRYKDALPWFKLLAEELLAGLGISKS